MSNSRKKRQSKCSKCGRFTNDHPGPAGKKCQLSRHVSDEEDSLLEYAGLGPPRASKDSVLHELADQLGQMSIQLKSVQDDMKHVKADVDDVRASNAGGSLPGPRTPTYSMPAMGGIPPHVETHTCLSSGAKVSSKVLQQARNGEYINLADFAPCLEPSLVTETSIIDGELVFKPKRTIKSMDSFLLWSVAWRTYEEYLVDYDPSLYKNFCAYRIFIQTSAARYWWPAVYSYDVRNRAKHSMDKSFAFQTIDNDIYVTTMDSSTVRQNVKCCSRCRSIWHNVQDCPFSESGALAQGPRQNSAPARPAGPSKVQNSIANQICYNWNLGRCFHACVRRHICETCYGPEPRITCSRCNATAGKQTPNKPPQQPGPTKNNYNSTT
jgi:hypothetical protein